MVTKAEQIRQVVQALKSLDANMQELVRICKVLGEANEQLGVSDPKTHKKIGCPLPDNQLISTDVGWRNFFGWHLGWHSVVTRAKARILSITNFFFGSILPKSFKITFKPYQKYLRYFSLKNKCLTEIQKNLHVLQVLEDPVSKSASRSSEIASADSELKTSQDSQILGSVPENMIWDLSKRVESINKNIAKVIKRDKNIKTRKTFDYFTWENVRKKVLAAKSIHSPIAVVMHLDHDGCAGGYPGRAFFKNRIQAIVDEHCKDINFQAGNENFHLKPVEVPIVLVSASARITKRIDLDNALSYDNGLSRYSLKQLEAELVALKLNCTTDMAYLADAMWEQGLFNVFIKQPKLFSNKLLLEYCNIHKAANFFQKVGGKNTQVHIHFFDDHTPITDNIWNFFDAHPDLIPQNVTFYVHNKLIHADQEREEIQYLGMIRGTGSIDSSWKKTLGNFCYLIKNQDGSTFSNEGYANAIRDARKSKELYRELRSIKKAKTNKQAYYTASMYLSPDERERLRGEFRQYFTLRYFEHCFLTDAAFLDPNGKLDKKSITGRLEAYKKPLTQWFAAPTTSDKKLDDFAPAFDIKPPKPKR